jgi:hypothetical protein
MQDFDARNGHHVTWQEADKSLLKAKGRSLRAMLDSTRREDGVGRYVAATVATIVVASAVGLSSVLAGPMVTGDVLTASLNPLGSVVERFSGAPASAHTLQECGPVAADVGSSTDAEVEATFVPVIAEVLPPIGPGGIPLDIPDLPVVEPSDDDDPSDDDPSDDDDPADDDPADDDPPADDPSDAAPDDNLVGGDVNLLGEDVLDIGILDGGLLDIGLDGLNPDGSGTETIAGVDVDGSEAAGASLDPQDEDIVDLSLNGEDPSEGLTDELTGDDLPVGLVEDILGDGPLDDLLGNDQLGGLLN